MPQPAIAANETAEGAIDRQVTDLRLTLMLMREPNAAEALDALWSAFPVLTAAPDRTGS